MSMPAWLNDVPPVSNNDNGTFNPSVDPSMAFLQTPTSTNFDFSPMQNPQLQQRMQNGVVRNGSPAFQAPAYQTQPIIPSKRPRGGSDMYGASPRQIPGALPVSRSQTPQQPSYLGYQGNVNGGQQMSAPTSYQHLQQGPSNNASPSPNMHDHNFNPQSIPQRMQTMSPSPFSPGAQNYPSQGSPPHSDYGSRVDTPQNGSHQYMQGMSYGPGQLQHFTPPPGITHPGSQGATSTPYAQNAANYHQPQRMYDMRQQQLVRQLQATNEAAQQRHHGGMANASQMSNYQQVARMQQMQQQQQQAMLHPQNPEQWIQTLTRFMHARSLPFNANPVFGGGSIPIHPLQLWTMVMKYGGSKKVTASNSWQTIAASLHLPPVQYPTGAQEVQSYWQNNLYPWEHAVLLIIQQNQQNQRRQRPVPNQMASMPPSFQGDNVASTHDQFSPIKQLHSQGQGALSMMHARRPSAADFQTPVKPMTTQQQDISQSHLNGYTTSLPVQTPNQQSNVYGMPQMGAAAHAQATPSRSHRDSFSTPGPRPPRKGSHTDAIRENGIVVGDKPWSDEFVPIAQNLIRSSRTAVGEHPVTWGGVQADNSNLEAHITTLIELRPTVPRLNELGLIDIRALNMSLKSGIHAEVRLALDTLATITSEDGRLMPILGRCDDLVDTLVDCAEVQVDLLAENAAEVSDVMLISPYEDVLRGCHGEEKSLLDVHEFGSSGYKLDCAVNRLICITTILRNFSDQEENHELLAEPHVIKFMTTVIRYLGTRNMLLRTHRNTLDFSKDIIIYLSNLADVIRLPGREEALCILHFLLSFAPSPSPTVQGSSLVTFAGYEPSIHRYLPAAVGSLAKILARDDPNRTFYKAIFGAESTSTPPYDLLTRAFALAIAPIPNHSRSQLAILEARKGFIAHGLLAAVILVTLIPSSEHSLARSWLMSGDGFATSLLRFLSWYIVERPPIPKGSYPGNRHVPDLDPQGNGMISNLGINILRGLAERAKDSTNPLSESILSDILPKKEALVRALRSDTIDRNALRQLCALAGLQS
ncbi:hypothetical protein MMC13_000069 [Lambiella insularis]|nr:hypothetical protein [Lambiella insularis]